MESFEDFLDISHKKETLDPDEIMSNGKRIRLNAKQFEAVQTGEEFLSGNEQFITFAGSAGTGKTTVSKAILAKAKRVSVVVTAPTHKAKKVVAEATGYDAFTIHKIIGLRPDTNLEEFTQDNVLFSLKGKSLLYEYDVLLVDEASMLPKALVDLMKQKARQFGIKIIFLGDPRQLPPVKEERSTVFTDPEIKVFWLEKVERQTVGNPLITLYDKILTHIDAIDHATYKKLLTPDDYQLLSSKPYENNSDITADGIGYEFFQNTKEFGAVVMQHFKIGEDTDNKVLCWSNATVSKYNDAIRNKLLGDKSLPPQVGELIMGYASVSDPDDWRKSLLENSAQYMIKSVEKGYKTHCDVDDKPAKAIEGYYVTMCDTDDDYETEKKIFIVAKESYVDLCNVEKGYSDFAKTAKPTNKGWAWKTYFDWRGKFQLLGDIVDNSGNKLVKKDVDYAYAQTVHKSQGSTYKNVFVIQGDIERCEEAVLRNRLLYVALSRPRYGAYILI